MRETITYMWRNKKNRLVMILCFGAVLLHSLLILPNTPGVNEVNIDGMERSMVGNRQTFEDNLEAGQTIPTMMTGTSAYEVARNEYVNQRELLTALETGDVRRYLEIPYRPSDDTGGSDSDDGLNFFSVLGTGKELSYQFMKNDAYVDLVDPLSFHIVHDRTSLQQLHLFLTGLGPYILLFLLLFMISDVTTKDRKLSTQKAGVPINWFVYLLLQSLAGLGFVLVFFLALTGVFVLLNGILHGFGTFNLPVGQFMANPPGEPFYLSGPGLMTIGQFFLKALPYFALLLYGFTRLTTLFSLLLKHDVVVLLASLFVLLFPQLYFGEGVRELMGYSVSWFPQTYFHFGDVATGGVSLLAWEFVPFTRGLIVLGVTIVIIELFIFLASKKIKRQAFVG